MIALLTTLLLLAGGVSAWNNPTPLTAAPTTAWRTAWIEDAYLQNASHAWDARSPGQVRVPLGTVILQVRNKTGMVCDHEFNDAAADFLCRKIGYDFAASWTNNERTDERNRAARDDMGRSLFVLDNLSCREGADSLGECSYRTPIGPHDCEYGKGVVLECGVRGDWKLLNAFTGADRNGSYYSTSYGTIQVMMWSNREGRWANGMVCDDAMTDATADFLCRQAGYEGLKRWSNNYNTPASHTLSPEILRRWNRFFALDQLVCPWGASDISQCSFNEPGHHDCSWGEGLVLNCLHDDGGFDLEDMTVTLKKGHGRHGPNGTVVLYGADGEQGFICGEDIDRDTAEFLCRAAGYRHTTNHSVAYETRHTDKLDCGYVKRSGLRPIVGEVDCPWNATDIGDCTAYDVHNGSTCDVDSALTLACSDDDSSFWEILNITLARNPGGGHEEDDVVYGRYGTVLATLINWRTLEQVTGLVSFNGTDSLYAGRALCEGAGYRWSSWPSYRKTGWIEEYRGSKLSCGYIIDQDIDFEVGWLSCPGSYPSLGDCRMKLADSYDEWDPDDALWLRC